jgi:cytochrome c-type biogenesis protein CcmF
VGLTGLGPTALALALVAAVAGAVLPVLRSGPAGRGVAWGRRALVAAWALLTLALVGLAAALARGDWSLVYVADYASRSTPWHYRLSALWAGMAGSLLVWAWFLAGWAVAVAWWCRRRAPPLAAGAQATLAALLALFTGLLVWAAPPFTRLQIPAIDGGGLTPVLRHPAMLYHPPLLYAGAVGLAVPFALAVAGHLGGGAWAAAARRWALGTLALLTAGMVAGAHWAYVELGWGGYWAWDPVENGALLPWLAGVAFVHAALAPDHRSRWPLALATLTFGLGLWGAFLTRSGATGSVHAFAEARVVGRALAGALVVLAAASLAVLVRESRRKQRDSRTRSGGGAGVLATNTVLLIMLVAVVFVGTALPLVWRWVTGDRLIVTGRYFAVAAWPLALAVLAAAGAALRLHRGPGSVRALLPAAPAGAALGLAAAPALVGAAPFAVAALALGGASAALVATDLWRRRPGALPALAAHLGVVVLLVGVGGTTAGEHTTGVLDGTQTVTVAGYTLRLEGVAPTDAGGPGAAVRADVDVVVGGERIATLRPVALVTERGDRVSVAGLRSTPRRDLMVVVRAVGREGDSVVVDVSVLPLAQWVWWGGLLVAAGLGAAALRPAARRAIPAPDPATPSVPLPASVAGGGRS